MHISDLRELAMRRRSIRGYDESREVSEEAIRAILECARWAPSGGNGQPWEFIVVRNKETRHKIADIYMKQMEQKREMDLAVRGTAKMTGDGFRHAPVHIVVLGDPRVKEAYPIRTKLEKADSHFITGLANATLLIHLAAAALGLASQYVSDANSPYMETMLKAMLGIPEPLRREPEEMIHYEEYDMKKFRDDAALEHFVKTLTLQGSYGKGR